MIFFKRLMRLSKRYRKTDDGTATLEFTLLFPFFIYIILGGAEIGYYTVSSTMLSRGLDIAMRDVRLGHMDDVTVGTLKTAVCGHATYVNNCESNIRIALEPVTAKNFTPPSNYAECLDRSSSSTQPATEFKTGTGNELMLVRACVIVDPMFPTSWLGAQMQKTPGSGYAIVATSGFVNEP
jgi:Flp pilus assembly protein TadG